MPIPQSQLSTWTNRGGTVASSNAYAAIDHALTATGSPVRGANPRIFLQGSYQNATNIHADSDIDVVCVFDGAQVDNRASLSIADQQLVSVGAPAVYHDAHLRRDALTSLRTAFGTQNVRDGQRAIKVNTGYGREADVVPAIRYIHYYRANFNLYFHTGIGFSRGNQWIYNFPTQHIDNGQAKNATGRTNGRYKPTVRMFKNARNKAEEKGYLAEGTAPSYFVEGLLYNVPDNLFTNDPEATFIAVFNHLNQQCIPANLISQNGIIPLLGIASTQWQLAAAQRFMAALRRLWNEWS